MDQSAHTLESSGKIAGLGLSYAIVTVADVAVRHQDVFALNIDAWKSGLSQAAGWKAAPKLRRTISVWSLVVAAACGGNLVDQGCQAETAGQSCGRHPP